MSDSDLPEGFKVVGSANDLPEGFEIVSRPDQDVQPKTWSDVGQAYSNLAEHPLETAGRDVGDTVRNIGGLIGHLYGRVVHDIHTPLDAVRDVSGVVTGRALAPALSGIAQTAADAYHDPAQAARSVAAYPAQHPVNALVGALSIPVGGEATIGGKLIEATGAGKLLSRAPAFDAATLADRQALSSRTGVPFSQGQQTGNLVALNTEDALRHGGRGGAAQQIAADFADTQANALRQAIPGGAASEDSARIGELLGDEFQSSQRAQKAVVDKAYANAFDPAALQASGAPALAPPQVMATLRQSADAAFDPLLPPDATVMPRTARLLNMLDKASQQYGTTGASWQRVDSLRRNITGALQDAKRTGGEDFGGIKTVLNAFDAQIGKVNPLLNQARQTFGSYADVFRPQATNASGVNNILRQFGNEANPGQKIFNTMFGAALKRGEAEPYVNALRQVYGGDTSAGMEAVRTGALQRLAVGPQGQQLSPTLIANNIEAALNGPQRGVYEALFDQATRDKLRDAARAARIINPAARNPSKTSYALMDAIRGGALGAARHVGVAGGAGVGSIFGGPVGAIGGAIGGGIADQAIGSIMARRAANLARRSFNSSPVASPAASAAGMPGLNAAQATLLAGARPPQQPNDNGNTPPMWLFGMPITSNGK